ncbi:MAG TPA: exo-beta-N-acetylmuramidase NamZ domain-containing protein, partial [Polyangiales bacterium]|nr:exo-beta-N-acetylmuramidase NamZ domain-containing protein [Polyangiales bacterium]
MAIGASPVPAVAPEPVAIGELPEVDSALRSAIAAKRLPGAVIAIGHRDGLVFLRAYGNRAVVPEVEPMTLDTIFDLASLTKPLTATLIMKRVEQGVVQLDEHASKYLPELAAHHGDVTVRELLLHTGAFAAENSLSDYQKGREAALAAIFRSRALSKRHEFHYSDLGYVVLGALLERVSNDSLDALAQRELFTPLHMRDTRFRPDASLRPRIAPTEVPDSVRKRIDPAAAAGEPVIRGDVHDPRAFLLGGVAGNAGAFTTASDLARFAQMLLSGGALDGVRVLRADTLAQMTAPSFVGTHDAVRALGWDMRSEYSGLRGTQLSYRAFGHGGYTGTSLWVDPDQDLFVIVLSNRVHPSGDGHMIKLAGEIADIASRHFARRPRPASCAALAGHVETGIDVLRAQDFAPLAGKRIGVVANDSSRTRDGLRTVDVLRQAKNVKLVALFAAEHGLDHSRHGLIADGADAATSLPVRSLYGKTKKPTPEMLRDVDAIVFDLQDVGVRFFTYLSTLRLILEAAAKQHVEVIVLDRPNPIGADVVEGALLEKASESFVGYHELPLRHGMTAGEIARMLIDERKIKAKLTVIAMRGYARELDYEQTGLRWYAPSPNLPDLD